MSHHLTNQSLDKSPPAAKQFQMTREKPTLFDLSFHRAVGECFPRLSNLTSWHVSTDNISSGIHGREVEAGEGVALLIRVPKCFYVNE